MEEKQKQAAQTKIRRILAAFSRIEKTDPEALKNLERLANLAEKTPAKYNLALKFL